MKIKDIGKTVTGKTPSTQHPEYFDGDYLFITPSDITKGGYIEHTERNLSEAGLNAISSNVVSGISVLVGCIGSDMGNVAWVDQYCATNQQINAITDFNSNSNPLYIYYYLSTKKEYLRQIAGNTTTPILSKGVFDEVEISLPDKIVQDKIVKLLRPIDRKIANNNAICKELESMAKTLYDYWFLQFDFPDEQGKPYKSSGGKMVYNETLKREIPEGWEVGKLGDLIASQKNGDWGSESKKKVDDIEVCCFRGADFVSITRDYYFTAPTRYIHKNSEESILQPGDLVIEISGGSTNQATGRIGYINQEFLNRSGNQMVCSNFCKAISLANSELQYWFYQTWQALYDIGIMFNFESKTTSIKNLMFDAFVRDVKVCVPNEKIAKVFNSMCTEYYCLIQKKFAESDALASLRDFLLPLLMNGQVKVG